MRQNCVLKKLSCTSAIIFLNLFVVFTVFARSKDDVVVLKNGDRLTGEIKSLQRGELSVKADYMAESVRLDWARIERLESKSTFMILLVDGQLFTSVMRLLPANSSDTANFVIGSKETDVRVPQLDVIRIIPAEAGFLKRRHHIRSQLISEPDNTWSYEVASDFEDANKDSQRLVLGFSRL